MKKIIDCWNKSDSEENEDNKNKIIFVELDFIRICENKSAFQTGI